MPRRLHPAVVLIAAALAAPAWASSHHRDRGGVDDAEGAYAVVFPLSRAEPAPRLTPGALDPRVNDRNIHQTICVPGWSRAARPPESLTEGIKRERIAAYGDADRRMRDYELDHLVPLELGGAGADARNLWPQPHHVAGGWGSYAKDRLEDRLHAMVCHDRLPLSEARRAIAGDWIAAYTRYIGPTPAASRRHRSGD